jgi:hypothetical protein
MHSCNIRDLPQDMDLRQLADTLFAFGLKLKVRAFPFCPFLTEAWMEKAKHERGIFDEQNKK